MVDEVDLRAARGGGVRRRYVKIGVVPGGRRERKGPAETGPWKLKLRRVQASARTDWPPLLGAALETAARRGIQSLADSFPGELLNDSNGRRSSGGRVLGNRACDRLPHGQ